MKYNINMKKICIFLLIMFILFSDAKSNISAYAQSKNVEYAKCLSNCVFYKSEQMSDNLNDIYFILPESYFVVLLNKINDNIYQVQYDKFIGYVKSNSIIVSTFKPVNKFLTNVTCDIKPTSGTQIWSNPSTNGLVLTTIPANYKNINYISFAYGEIPIGGNSNIWYYVTYTPSTNLTNVYEGYIYSENATNLSEIILNLESNPEVINENDILENDINFSSTLKTIIVAIISIPIILLISIILYKLIKILQKKTIYDKNQNNYTIENKLNSNQKNDLRLNDLNTDSLKSKIDEMAKTNYVRKTPATYFGNENKHISNFPEYDSEDDLL